MQRGLKKTISTVLALSMIMSTTPIGHINANAETTGVTDAEITSTAYNPVTTIPDTNISTTIATSNPYGNVGKILTTTGTVQQYGQLMSTTDTMGIATSADNLPSLLAEYVNSSVFENSVVVYSIYNTFEYPVKFGSVVINSNNEWSLNINSCYSSAEGAGTAYDVLTTYVIIAKVDKSYYNNQDLVQNVTHLDVNTTIASTYNTTIPNTDTTMPVTTIPETGTTSVTTGGTVTTTSDPYPVTGTTVSWNTTPATVTTTAPTPTTTTVATSQEYGDINGDGKISVADIVMMANVIVGRIEITDSMKMFGDTNADGKISVADMITIAKKLVNSSSEEKDITQQTYDISQFSLNTIDGAGLRLENQQKLDNIKNLEELNTYKTWIEENYPHETGTNLDTFLTEFDENTFSDKTLVMVTYYNFTPSDYIFKFNGITKNTDGSLNLNLKAGSESETNLPNEVNVPRFVAMLIPNADLNSDTITSVTFQPLYGEMMDYDSSNYVTNVWRTENKDYTFTADNEKAVINSSEELQSFISSFENKDDMSFLMSSSDDVLVGFNNLFENYDDTFFTNNNLIICSTPYRKGRYIGTNIKYNSNTMNIINNIDCMPMYNIDGTGMVTNYYHNIILEIPKTDMATIKTINLGNSYPL